MQNLDDAIVFKPMFEEIIGNLQILADLEVMSIQSLSESEIIPSLHYLRDLCYVVLEFIKNEEAREII